MRVLLLVLLVGCSPSAGVVGVQADLAADLGDPADLAWPRHLAQPCRPTGATCSDVYPCCDEPFMGGCLEGVCLRAAGKECSDTRECASGQCLERHCL